MTLFLIIISFLAAALVPLVIWYAWNIRRRLFFENFKLQLYLIRIPLASKEGKDPKAEVNLSEQLFNALASLKRPFVFEAAVSHVGEDICFYIAVPRAHGGMAARQIQGLFPDAQVEETGDYNLFNPHGEAQGASVTQKHHYALPIRTYQDIGGETFAPILSGLSKINTAGEGAAIQVIARPASGEVKKTIAAALQRLKARGCSPRAAEPRFLRRSRRRSRASGKRRESRAWWTSRPCTRLKRSSQSRFFR